jgi:hypothetical protein
MHFIHSQDLIDRFKEEKIPLPKAMRYAAQVVWVLDPLDAGMVRNGRTLEAKRAAAGEPEKTHLVMGLNPELGKLPNEENIRLYICAHGTEIRDEEGKLFKFGIQIGQNGENDIQNAQEFFPILRRLIEKMPSKKVQRISLVMCNSAGIVGEVSPDESFAQELVNLCQKELTTDITGRRGKVRPQYDSNPKGWPVNCPYRKLDLGKKLQKQLRGANHSVCGWFRPSKQAA